MKKLLALLFVAVVSLTFTVGCGSTTSSAKPAEKDKTEEKKDEKKDEKK